MPRDALSTRVCGHPFLIPPGCAVAEFCNHRIAALLFGVPAVAFHSVQVLAHARRSTLTERVVDDQAAAFAAGEGFERGGIAQAGGFFQRPVCQRTGIVEIALRFEAVAHDALLAELVAHRHFVAGGSVLLRAFFDEGGATRLRTCS